MKLFHGLFGTQRSRQRKRYMCESKDDVFDYLNYMVLYAPDFPAEDEMTLDLAFESVESGLKSIETVDGRPAVVEVIERIRSELAVARELFDAGQTVPACHKLQDAEDLLRPVRVKASVA
ncbi:hypothetical protein [Lysobacter soli]|uniref:hypothetical protein n=1 Tax=Lysobacter soli TaxID=453783 RepID=UPI003CE73BBB